MSSKATSLTGAFCAAIVWMNSAAADTVAVTFTVPVQIQNIHSNWSKVGVFCMGWNDTAALPVDVPVASGNFGTNSGAAGTNGGLVGFVDVSNKARQSINQTVTGTIQVPSDSRAWECQLWLQFTGDTTWQSNLGQEVTSARVVYATGKFY